MFSKALVALGVIISSLISLSSSVEAQTAVFCEGQPGWQAEISFQEDGTPVAQWWYTCDGVKVLLWGEKEGESPALSPTSIWDVVASEFPEEPDFAWGVALCESDLDGDGQPEPWQTGDQGERGIFQIHPIHIPRIIAMGFTWDQMFEVWPNVAVARAIYDEAGWTPWSCA